MISKALLITVLIAYVEARFGQEQVPIPAISAVQGGDPGAAATVAGAAISDLLGGANSCAKLQRADQVVSELGGGADAIAAAMGLVTAEKNTNPFANNNTQNVCGDPSLPATAELRGITPLIDPDVDINGDAAALSASSAANPLAADGMSVFDLMNQAGLGDLVVSQAAAGGAAGGAARDATVGGNNQQANNDQGQTQNQNQANGNDNGNNNNQQASGNQNSNQDSNQNQNQSGSNNNNQQASGNGNGNGNGNNEQNSNAGGNASCNAGNAGQNATESVNQNQNQNQNQNENAGNNNANQDGNGNGDGNQNAGNENAGNDNAGNDNAGNDNAGNDNAGNDNAGNDDNNNANAGNNDATVDAGAGAAAGGASSLAGADFGQCTPTIIFEGGANGRPANEFTFQIADELARGGQQEALNPNIITNALCNQLTNVCNANAAAKAACEDGKAQVQAAGTRDKSTADLFNSAVGFAGAVTNPSGGPAEPPAGGAAADGGAAASDNANKRSMRRGFRL